MRERILFVSEAITLAQVVRLVVLARALDPARYEVHFAAASFPELVFRPHEFIRWPLHTVDGSRALRRLARGGRLYGGRTLARYVHADRELIRAVRPSLIVGDLRWSLAISAPAEGVRHAALANAYMSPFAIRDRFPLPDHPMVRLLGERLAERYFPRALPSVFKYFAEPVNRLRRMNAQQPVGSLLDVLTFGDLTLYADPPGLVPVHALPPTHRFLGPVLWSAPGAPPAEWGMDPRRPALYVTLGSSGDVRLVSRIVEALVDEPVDVLLATAGRANVEGAADRIRVVPFVDGRAAAARAALVISNGGSTTGYQALAGGTPVLGLPQNLEQHLASEAMSRTGAAAWISAPHVTASGLRAAVRGLIADDGVHMAAKQAAETFRAHDSGARFRRIVDRALSRGRPAAAADEPVRT
jgi:UDP:flavonoid glycosyltransferase YjiC (YdhE family)